MTGGTELSVVVFAFNEEANIAPVLQELRSWLADHEPTAEIVFVDDIVIGERLICHDYGRMEQGELLHYQPGDFPFPGMGGEPGYALPIELTAAIEEALEGFERPLLSAQASGGEARHAGLAGSIQTGAGWIAGHCCCEASQTRSARFPQL